MRDAEVERAADDRALRPRAACRRRSCATGRARRRGAGARCGRSGGRASRRSGRGGDVGHAAHPTRGASSRAGRLTVAMRRQHAPDLAIAQLAASTGRRRRRARSCAPPAVAAGDRPPRARGPAARPPSRRLRGRPRALGARRPPLGRGARAAATRVLSHGSAAARVGGIAARRRSSTSPCAAAPASRSRAGIRVAPPAPCCRDDEVTTLARRCRSRRRRARCSTSPRDGARRDRLAAAVDRAEQLRLIDFAELRALLDAVPGPPRDRLPQSGVGVRTPARPTSAATWSGWCTSSARAAAARRDRSVNVVVEGGVRDFAWPATAARRRGGLVRLAPLAGRPERRPRARRGADARRLARPALHLRAGRRGGARGSPDRSPPRSGALTSHATSSRPGVSGALRS